MQSSFGIIMLAIVDGQPKVLTLREVLGHFIEHRKEIVTRRTIFELKKAEARAHILEGLKIALDNLDEVIQVIKTSATPAEAKERLVARFELSEIQAQAILDMRLHRLTGLERDKIIEEYNEVMALIDRLKEILASEVEILKIIKGELLEIRERYADARRTEIIDDGGRSLHRGPDRRRGHGGHRVPYRLHQAQRGFALPRPAPRRQGYDRDASEGRGFRRKPLHCLDPQLYPDFYQPGQGLLAQGPRDSTGRARRARQGDRQPA